MTIPLAKAQRIAVEIVNGLREHCHQISVAGSIRRWRPVVGDIDIVALPKPGQFAELRARLIDGNAILTDGHQTIIVQRPDGIQIDLWLATPEQSDLFGNTTLTNYGSLLLCRTGSKEHNIRICQEAIRRKRRWHPHKGVFDGETLVASATEEDVFKAVGMRWIHPRDREA